MAEVTLYHWEPNANSGKPMLALMEKGVAFDTIQDDPRISPALYPAAHVSCAFRHSPNREAD